MTLRAWNLTAGILHLVQAVAVAIIVASSVRLLLPVTVEFAVGPPGTAVAPERIPVTSVDIGIGAVVVLLLPAAMHLLVASPVLAARYRSAIESRRNPIRWIELGLSSAIMLYLIAQLNGVSSLVTLVLIYTAQSALVLLLWMQERLGTPARTLQPFVIASAVGIVPWGVIALQVLAPGATIGYDQPGWIRILTVILLLLFFAFGINQWLGFRATPTVTAYVNEERAYIALSLATKAVFAWQVVAGILITHGATS
ncbi:MAG: heliorhodopsin HeR [Salinibacterium sp.]|nr:heliorhodopsin HeR [Salinibacterium sp.]